MAAARGLKEICFTEHIDFDPTDSCYGTFNYALYLNQIDEARGLFGNVMSIRCGVEIDYQDKYRSQIRDFFDGKKFDYIIGAAHYVNGIILENHNRYFPGKTASEAYMPYFDNTLAAVETGLFDCIAHLDLCKRYGVRYLGPFNWEPYRERIEEILRAVISKDMALEINTSGLRQSPKDIYPTEGILSLYRSLGGSHITVGSDSHKVEDVGAGVIHALGIARNTGFNAVSVFTNRCRNELNIAEMLEATDE